MEWLWLVTALGWFVAFSALAVARRLSRRLAQLSEQYWELKYEVGELKARVRAIAPTAEEASAAQPAAHQAFVPLTAVKRGSA